MSDSLPSIVEYFNTMIFPRFPHLGMFSEEGGKVVCPFHDDINPSMGIIPGTEVFHCFGCGAHGNVIELHRRFLQTLGYTLSTEESLTDLTDAFGITYTPPSPEERAKMLFSSASMKYTVRKFTLDLKRVQNSTDWTTILLKALT